MAALGLIVMVGSALASASQAQHPAGTNPQHYRVEFEDDQVRVLRVSLGPGDRTPVYDHPDAVLIYLTADFDGHMPVAEAVWQPTGAYALENRARTPFEAILVELIAPVSGVPASVAPEAVPVAFSFGDLAYSLYDRQAHRVSTLVENARVTVTRHRLVPLLRTEPYHFHPRETLLVYLAGGEMSGSTGHRGFRHARRGEFDVLPADTLHALGNVGNDPIEFVMIAPK